MTTESPLYNYSDEQGVVLEAYQQLRKSLLADYYWSAKSESAKRVMKYLQVITAVGSSAALLGILQASWPGSVSIIGAIAAVAASVAPALGLSEKASRCDRLAFGYHNLFARYDDWRVRLRQAGELTVELQAEARLLSAELAQVTTLESGNVDKSLQKSCTADVNRQIPAESLWLPS